ncbi:MAG: DUF58 domain-containing protein [Clostridiales Family XIII bacterium]|jgi:hypothetical protein|nr:DUF58 domain-containing protein [Clostridiales Family XIII bacterium]
MRNDSGVDSSYLVNPIAIGAYLISCVATAIYHQTTASVFLGFIFLLTLASYLWAKYALKHVDYDLETAAAGIFPGQKFSVIRTIRNQKMLPLIWMEIVEPCLITDPAMPDESFIAVRTVRKEQTTIEVKIYERFYTLSLIKWHQSVRFQDEWEAKRRGITQIKASELRSGDGFGLCVKRKQFEFQTPKRITVFPELTAVSVDRIINDMWDTRSASGGFLKDKTIIKSVRDYLPGDPARDINMRLLARGGTLKINTYEIVTPDSVRFILDAASFRNSEADDFEHTLSVIASLIVGLTKRGIATSLMTPASAWFPETCTVPSAGLQAQFAMLELLSAVSPEDVPISDTPDTGKDVPGRIYFVAASLACATSLQVLEQYPEHKTQLLLLDSRMSVQCGLHISDLNALGKTS